MRRGLKLRFSAVFLATDYFSDCFTGFPDEEGTEILRRVDCSAPR